MYGTASRRTMTSPRRTKRNEVSRGKIGRNEPCWCGSGKKYKHCHLDRENQPPLKPWEALKLYKQAFSDGICLAPDSRQSKCSGKIVEAHTVPKSGSLKQIARKGHVYSFNPSIRPFDENKRLKSQEKLKPESLGINKASTFTGFCSYHDDAIFAPIEKQAFCGTPEQCFLLGYRALTRELYAKRGQRNSAELARNHADKGKPLSEQFKVQGFYQEYLPAIEAGLRKLSYYKSISDKILETQNFDAVRAYIIELAYPPPVMGSGGFYPEQDFKGVKLQSVVGDEIPDLLFFTSFFGGECGVVAFTWLSENAQSCRAFIKSLDEIPDKSVTAALLRCFFEYCENVHIQPDWWEALPSRIRNAAIQRLQRSMTSPAFGNIRDDGITHDPWPVKRRYKIPSDLEL